MKKSFIFSLMVLLCCQFFSANAQQPQQTEITVQVTQAQKLGTTLPLRHLVPRQPIDPEKRKALKKNKQVPPNFYRTDRKERILNPDALPKGADAARQLDYNHNTGLVVEPLVNVEGLSFNGPPDPSGDVGLDHYMQAVNATAIEIFNKEGESQAVFSPNTIWNQVNSTGAGDPIIIFDQEVNRWLITEFTSPGINTLLIGISEDADPMGSYTAYSFAAPQFPDYPKYAVWKDVYAMSSNEEGANTMVSYFIDKNALLAGEPNVDIQRITMPGTAGFGGPGIMVSSPADWSGNIEPVNGNPILVSLDDDEWGGVSEDLINVHTVEIDWENSNNTTVTTQNLVVTPYDTDPCFPGSGQFGECIPQAGFGGGFSGITQIIMNQTHYRNFNTHESLIMCFTVDATAGENLAGIRWTELRRTPGEDWSVYQEGTYSLDDGLSRFVPSIAMDAGGNIGLGYSVSSPDIFPQLRFTGRRVSDPLGEMTVEEYTLAEGLTTLQTFQRFGDYAHMTIDPVDQRTFWFTGEYSGQNTAATRVAAFQIRRDTTDFQPTALLTPQSADDLTDMETVQIEIKNAGLDTQSVFKVGYIFENGTAVIDDVDMELVPDSVYVHTFVPTVDMSEIGDYEFKIFTVLDGDQAPFNDTLRAVVSKLPRWDAGIVNVEGLDGANCVDEVEAGLELINFGTQTLTSATITVEMNGNLLETIEWTGELESGESEIVNVTVTGFLNGANELIATSSNPSGMTDEIMANDGFTRNFSAIVGGVSATIQILTDDFPGETTWEVTDETGAIIYAGGPYNQQETLEEFEMCLDSTQCYTFTIFDTYGDGICCGYGFGNYQIVDVDGNPLIQDTGEFGFEESNDFCPIFMCALEGSFDVSPEVDNNENGSIMITAMNGNAPYMYSIDGGVTFQNSNIFNGLPADTYEVLITDGSECSYTEIVVVDMIVPTSGVIADYSVEVMPNPTDGVFRINFTGLEKASVYLPYEIFSESGHRIQNGQLVKYDGNYTGTISLYAYPAGLYFVRFLDEDVSRLVKVIKE